MKWYDVYEHICLIGQFWKMYDKAQYKQRWGLVRNTTSKERYKVLVKQGFQNTTSKERYKALGKQGFQNKGQKNENKSTRGRTNAKN